jgi:excisionase family DNA binding protein
MKVGNDKNKLRALSAGQNRVSLQSPVSPDAFSGRKRYFTTSQLMSRWGVSAPTVIRLIEEGELRGLKIRGAYRVDKESIESYEKKVAF